MFSHTQLRLIISMCEDAIDAYCSAAKMFDLGNEQERKKFDEVVRQKIQTQEVKDTCERLLDWYEDVDAADMVDRLGIISKYKAWSKEQVETAEMTTLDYGFAQYVSGYMQGKAELGCLDVDDLNVIDNMAEVME